jgi:hypothetical protein
MRILTPTLSVVLHITLVRAAIEDGQQVLRAAAAVAIKTVPATQAC